jgi:hypothetical protein
MKKFMRIYRNIFLIVILPFWGWIEYLEIWNQGNHFYSTPPLKYLFGALPIFVAVGIFGIFVATSKASKSARWEHCLGYVVFAPLFLFLVAIVPGLANIDNPRYGSAKSRQQAANVHPVDLKNRTK